MNKLSKTQMLFGYCDQMASALFLQPFIGTIITLFCHEKSQETFEYKILL